jgi:hypothetical protein
MPLEPLQHVHEKNTEYAQRDHGRRVTYPGLLFILADSAKPINQALQRVKNGMKECSLALKDAIHESTNRLRNGDHEGKKDYDLCSTE